MVTILNLSLLIISDPIFLCIRYWSYGLLPFYCKFKKTKALKKEENT